MTTVPLSGNSSSFLERMTAARTFTGVLIERSPSIETGGIALMSVQPELSAINSAAQEQINTIAFNQKGQMNQLMAEAANATPDQRQSFIDRMNASKAAAEEQAKQVVDSAYDQLTAVGQQNPGSQDAIVSATAALSSALNSAVQGMDSAYSSAVSGLESVWHDVESGVISAGSAIVSAAGSVASGIEEGIESIGDALSSLFG